jgi:hypothetical protein
MIKVPATQRGQAYRLSSGKWGLRYYDADGGSSTEDAVPK